MKYTIYILALFLLASCKKEEFNIENLNGNRIDILGHAGSGISSLYPINSAESILNCLNSGADGTEIDVQLTNDNVLVLFHDKELEEKTTLSGLVRSHTWTELEAANYTTTPYLQYRIIRLDQLFLSLPDYYNFLFTFDIKLNPRLNEDYNQYLEDFTDALVSLYATYQLHNTSFIESQSTDFLSLMNSKDSSVKQFIYPQVFEDGYAIAQNLNLYGITISNENIEDHQVLEAHNNGFFVTIWGVQSKSEHEDAIHKNPDVIQTDDISGLIDLLPN